MERHLDEQLTVDELARRARMSPRTFARKFRAETGTTPHHWLTTQRVVHAQWLLETTIHDLDTIARQSGFGNAATLRHHFARRLGTNPPLPADLLPLASPAGGRRPQQHRPGMRRPGVRAVAGPGGVGISCTGTVTQCTWRVSRPSRPGAGRSWATDQAPAVRSRVCGGRCGRWGWSRKACRGGAGGGSIRLGVSCGDGGGRAVRGCCGNSHVLTPCIRASSSVRG